MAEQTTPFASLMSLLLIESTSPNPGKQWDMSMSMRGSRDAPLDSSTQRRAAQAGAGGVRHRHDQHVCMQQRGQLVASGTEKESQPILSS